MGRITPPTRLSSGVASVQGVGSVGGDFTAESGFLLTGSFADGELVTITKTGGGFGTKPNGGKPLIWWTADDGANPSSLGQLSAWQDSGVITGEFVTDVKAPGSTQSVRGALAYTSGHFIPDVMASVGSPEKLYMFRKLREGFKGDVDYSIFVTLSNIVGSVARGDIVTGQTSGVTAVVDRPLAAGGSDTRLYFQSYGASGTTLAPGNEFQLGEIITSAGGFSGTCNSSGVTESGQYKSLRIYGWDGSLSSSNNATFAFNINNTDFFSMTPANPSEGTYWSGSWNNPIRQVKDAWHNDELIYQISSSVGTTDAILEFRRGSKKPYTKTWALRDSTRPNGYGRLWQPSITNGAQYPAYVWADCLYFDETWCRVFVSEEPTYQDSVLDTVSYAREVCIPATWADGQITCYVRKGSFNSLAGKSLYVVTNDGTAFKIGVGQ